jgi:hypothetical protein
LGAPFKMPERIGPNVRYFNGTGQIREGRIVSIDHGVTALAMLLVDESASVNGLFIRLFERP